MMGSIYKIQNYFNQICKQYFAQGFLKMPPLNLQVMESWVPKTTEDLFAFIFKIVMEESLVLTSVCEYYLTWFPCH